MNLKFKCNCCGLCCRNIQYVEELKEFHNGDGICFYLDKETNLCKIYNHRPSICNIEKSYKKYSTIYTEKEYLQKNYEGCNVLWEKVIQEKRNEKK